MGIIGRKCKNARKSFVIIDFICKLILNIFLEDNMELTRLQQNKLDTLLLYLEQENCSPVWMIQILANDRIANIFMRPEDIEDIQLEEQKVFFTSEEFRKLSSFAKFAHKNNIFDLEKVLHISDTSSLWNLTVHDIIKGSSPVNC